MIRYACPILKPMLLIKRPAFSSDDRGWWILRARLWIFTTALCNRTMLPCGGTALFKLERNPSIGPNSRLSYLVSVLVTHARNTYVHTISVVSPPCNTTVSVLNLIATVTEPRPDGDEEGGLRGVLFDCETTTGGLADSEAQYITSSTKIARKGLNFSLAESVVIPTAVSSVDFPSLNVKTWWHVRTRGNKGKDSWEGSGFRGGGGEWNGEPGELDDTLVNFGCECDAKIGSKCSCKNVSTYCYVKNSDYAPQVVCHGVSKHATGYMNQFESWKRNQSQVS